MSLDTRLRSLADEHDAVYDAVYDVDDALAGALAIGHRKVVRRRTGLAAMALVLTLGLGAAVTMATGGDNPTETNVVDEPPTTVDDDDDLVDPPAIVQPTTTTVVQPPPEPAAPGALPRAGQPIANGRYFGFVRSVDTAKRVFGFDVAQWLEGEEADKAAREDGEDDTADYYVRNNSTEVRALSGSSGTVITLERQPDEKERSSFAGLAARVQETNGGMYAWVTLRDGDVVDITEQWVP